MPETPILYSLALLISASMQNAPATAPWPVIERYVASGQWDKIPPLLPLYRIKDDQPIEQGVRWLALRMSSDPRGGSSIPYDAAGSRRVISWAEGVVKRNTNSAHAHLAVAFFYYSDRQASSNEVPTLQVIEECKRAIELDPQLPWAYELWAAAMSNDNVVGPHHPDGKLRGPWPQEEIQRLHATASALRKAAAAK